MTELFSAEHRTFFTATFHIFVLLNDSHYSVVFETYLKYQNKEKMAEHLHEVQFYHAFQRHVFYNLDR